MTESNDTLRERVEAALVAAMRARDTVAVSTARLIKAAIKDRDIVARGAGKPPLGDDDIRQLLQTMIKQRRDSIAHFTQANRHDLAKTEQCEIDVITSFLPTQLSHEQMQALVAEEVARQNATSLKELGNVIVAIKKNYAGQVDVAVVSRLAREQLS